jgi:arylsulfate sulfotransferase
MKQSFLLRPAIAAIITLQIVSCQKDNTPINNTTGTARPVQNVVPPISNHANDTDTSQNAYQITLLSSPETGQLLLSPNPNNSHSPGLILITDQNGHVLKKKTFSSNAGNFQKWTINGKVRYGYELYDLSAPAMAGVGYWPGYEIITDSNLNEIDRVYLQAYGNITNIANDLDGHDFVFIDDHHYILESYYHKTVNNIPVSLDSAGRPMQVVADIIQEVNNGTVVWQWDATDYPEFYTSSLEGNQFNDTTIIHDYLHLNSMFIDTRDNNLICSFRNADQVIKIERGTGKILWRLGGKNSDFAMGQDQVFLRQHHATLTDNNATLILFDDGEINTRASSRILEFNLNETAKNIEGFRYFDIPEPFTQYQGSVQKRGDTYFIGGGTASYVLEVNYLTGQKLLELKSSSSDFYRAYKF